MASLKKLSFLFMFLFCGTIHAQTPLTLNIAPCNVITAVGNCGSIPTALPYNPIFIPSTSTSTQALPAAGTPFYETDYGTVTPYSSPCGTVAFTCAERIFDPNTWNVTMPALPGGNPCPGTFTGAPGSVTPSGSDVLVISKVSTNLYTSLVILVPGGCMVLEDINLATGALTNLRGLSGISGGAGEIHADYNTPSIWYGCLSGTTCYKGVKLNSATMTTTQIFDLSNSAVANLPLSVTDPGVVGGAGWVTDESDGHLCGQLGPQDNALLAVCVDPSINPPNGCAIWWRVDTGDLGGGACWPGGPPTCSGCAQLSPLSNVLAFTGSVTGNGTTATGTVASTPPWGPNYLTIQGCASFNGRSLTGVVISGTTISWNSSFVGSASGCSIGQQLGLHGGGQCQDGTESSWSLVPTGTIVWAQGTLTNWHAASIDGKGHRTCGYHSLVAGPSNTSATPWVYLNSSIVNSTISSGSGKMAYNDDGHYFWPANPSETNLMYAQTYCATYSSVTCPSANANCAGCGEVSYVGPLPAGVTYRILQTRKNICANAPVLANCIGGSTAYFYDEVSGQCSSDGYLCIVSTNWADVNTGVPTLGSVTQGSLTVYRNDILALFIPVGSAVSAPGPPKSLFAIVAETAGF